MGHVPTKWLNWVNNISEEGIEEYGFLPDKKSFPETNPQTKFSPNKMVSRTIFQGENPPGKTHSPVNTFPCKMLLVFDNCLWKSFGI